MADKLDEGQQDTLTKDEAIEKLTEKFLAHPGRVIHILITALELNCPGNWDAGAEAIRKAVAKVLGVPGGRDYEALTAAALINAAAKLVSGKSITQHQQEAVVKADVTWKGKNN